MRTSDTPGSGALKGMTPEWSISRRSFLRRCATVAAATGLPAWYVEQQLARAADEAAEVAAMRRLGPNDRPHFALIGCGGMGMADGGNAAGRGEMVAVCDVDASHAAHAAAEFTKDGKAPAIYGDFREVMARSDVDIVVNATPDHWHTLVNLAAVGAGKHVYSEKPLTLTIDEGRHIVAAVRAAGVTLQTGTQQRSMMRFRMACEMVRNGRIGKLTKAQVWLPEGLSGGPFATAPVPSELNWDFWLGQAPAVDYVPERCHAKFRFWYDYSGGTMTDWGAHHIDIAQWAIGLLAPETVEAEAFAQPVPGGYTAYANYAVRYAYANGVALEVRTTPDDSIYGAVVNPQGQRNGVRFEGTDGWIWVNRSELKASDPDLLRQPLPDDAERLYVSKDHMGNLLDCIVSGERPICDVETGHRSASICHLGAIALRTGRALRWDALAERFVGDHADEANGYLARPMRAPYDYSFVS